MRMPMIPHPDKSRSIDFGIPAWGVIGLYAILYDILAARKGHRTLSAAFYAVSSSKYGRPGLVGFWVYLSAHLFRALPKRFDLFRRWFG